MPSLWARSSTLGDSYITDYYSELRPLHGAVLVGNEPPVLPPLLGLLGADLEVLAYQI
jgi:hypothetical protein